MQETAMTTAGIQPDVTYPLGNFKLVSGFGDHAMRTARKNGLRVMYTGGRAFVKGSDFIAYLDRKHTDRQVELPDQNTDSGCLTDCPVAGV